MKVKTEKNTTAQNLKKWLSTPAPWNGSEWDFNCPTLSGRVLIENSGAAFVNVEGKRYRLSRACCRTIIKVKSPSANYSSVFSPEKGDESEMFSLLQGANIKIKIATNQNRATLILN